MSRRRLHGNGRGRGQRPFLAIALVLIFALAVSGCTSSPEKAITLADTLLAKGKAVDAEAALAEIRAPQGELLARVRVRQAEARLLLADFPSARRLLDEADRTAGEAQSLRASIDLRRGTLLARTGDSAGADRLFRSALAVARQTGDRKLEAAAAGNLSVLLLRASRYEEALYWLERTRVAFAALGESDSVAKAMGNIGWCYFRLGDYERARNLFERAIEHYAKAGNLAEEQFWTGNLASVYTMERRFSEARRTYERALAVARRLPDDESAAQWLSNLAAVAIDQKDWDAATRFNDEALAAKQRVGMAGSRPYSVHNNARILMGRGRPLEAVALFKEVMQSARESSLALDARVGLAEAYAALGDSASAETEFRAALAGVQEQRLAIQKLENRAAYFASLIRLYQRYVSYLIARGQTWEALEIVESSRARLTDAEPKHVVLDRAGLMRVAGSMKAALISIWVAPERSFLWCVTERGVQFAELPDQAVLRELVIQFRGVLESLRDPLTAEHNAGRRLAAALLGRLDLANVNELVVAADGPLHGLSFDALPVDDKYLIDRFVVTQVAALRALLHESKPTRGPALFVGDTDAVGEEFPKLKWSGTEIDALERVWDGPHRTLRGSAAQVQAFRDSIPGKYSVIHLSAHAVADQREPLESAILLSPGPAGARITARDLLSIPLSANLVSVSACRGAGARQYSGEGMLGLTWALLQSGARNVISGLWDVNDRSSATLMAKLYQEMSLGHPASRALHRSKLALAHSGGSLRLPYYWSAFQLFRGSR